MSEKTPIIYTKAPPLSDPDSNFGGFEPGTKLLPMGYVHKEGALPLPCDIIYDRDVAVTMRDGVKIYVDIFRPTGDEKVPALINSTTFGKIDGYFTLDILAKKAGNKNRFGIPKSKLSDLMTWEGIDPAFWCNHGYAVVNVDMRGVGMSEGDANYFGTQDSNDNYDIIEYLGVQDWCNGKVSMVGNSWLAITQWYVAAKNPPHLAAIAPWEGHANMYVDEYMKGGIPYFPGVRVKMAYGNNGIEDLTAMMKKYPLMNDYWEDKAADFEKITVPAYVVASYTSDLHSRGTIEGFRRMSSKEKWLRIHHTQEWPDLYDEYNTQDLLRFLDHYLKGINNGWENTPKVRMAILDPGGEPSLNRVEEDFPLKRQELKKLFLDCGEKLGFEPVEEEKKLEYVSDDDKTVVKFRYRFTEETEITGYIKAKLWVEALEHDDMDLFINVSKLDADGTILYHDARLRMYSGPDQRQRVSLRRLDPYKSTETEPVQTFKEYEKLKPGEIVPVEIGFWPTAMKFHAGQYLEFSVAGFPYMVEPSIFSDLKLQTENVGKCAVHMGGRYDSHILVPFIPQK